MKIINITASRHAVFYSPLLAMVNGNFLEEEGLKAIYHKPNANINVYKKIESKEIDVAQSAVSGSWNFFEKKINMSIKHFALINSRDGFFIISKNLKEFKWNDLYKDPFYYVRGGQPEAMLSFALSKKNISILKIPNVSNKTLSTPEMISKYKKEKKGFLHEQGSYPHQLSIENQGKIVKSIGEIIGPVAFSSLCAEEKWIKSEQGIKFSRAFEKAKKWVNTSDPNIVGKLIKSHFEGFSLESISKAIQDYQMLRTWDSGIEISKEEYDTSLDVFEHSKLISKRYSIDDVVSYS
tara:strand:+ start:3031 stop:3912 length:882 start_codon:yes stop_codon:yes gene_type:complete